MAGDIVYFDLETRRTANDVGGWGNKHMMGISVACTFSTGRNEYSIYTQEETPDLIRQLKNADLVVGFNHIGFDYEVLKGHDLLFDSADLPHSLDLLIDLEKVLGHRIKLDAVAAATLGMGKTADGLDALKWWQQGEVAKIAEYCCYDVKVTKCVHEYGMEHGHVKYHDRNGREQTAKVNWKPVWTPLLRLLLRAGWAPLAVLIFHQKIMRTPWRQQLDFVMHYSGGVAISFFLWHALDCFAHWFGSLTPFARYLFTFALACTVGLFWEFAELFSDVFLGTHIQHHVRETMRDLIADATGALTTLALTWLVRCFTQRSVQ